MTVVHTKFVIIDIIPMQKAEINALGFSLMKQPDLDMYHMKAILKSWGEKTQKGREFLRKIGLEEHLSELDKKYLEYTNAFVATIPIAHKTLNENKYHVGSEIMIAYYPTTVWATFHAEGEKDNEEERR